MEKLLKQWDDSWLNKRSKLPVNTLKGEEGFSNHQMKKFLKTLEKLGDFS